MVCGVWCRVVWCHMVSCGVVWCRVVSYDVVWWCGVVWCCILLFLYYESPDQELRVNANYISGTSFAAISNHVVLDGIGTQLIKYMYIV